MTVLEIIQANEDQIVEVQRMKDDVVSNVLYKGLLSCIPEEVQVLQVCETGWLMVADCAVITVV